jgi:predicted nucleic acid-binding protein
MSAYVDANALVRYYLNFERREQLLVALGPSKSPASWPVPITDLLRFEVNNAIERMVFETRNGGTAQVTMEMGMVAHSDFETDISSGRFLMRTPLTLADIETEYDTLVRRYTATHGFRTYDVMHVCSALKLRCKRFLSFDAKANVLAKLVGLKTL